MVWMKLSTLSSAVIAVFSVFDVYISFISTRPRETHIIHIKRVRYTSKKRWSVIAYDQTFLLSRVVGIRTFRMQAPFCCSPNRRSMSAMITSTTG